MAESLTRRAFQLSAGAAVFSAITARKGLLAQSQAQKVEVSLGSEIGTVNPYLHSHFAEHLGACIYGGLWVGRNSKIPNINGYRRQAVEWLKELGVPVLRWPGGCFGDEYHWRDGIGPVAQRRKIVNVSWGGVIEDNSFGTHEFIGLCRAIGAEPYLSGNMGSGTPQEMRDWMEYCNQPKGSSLAEERAANGSPAPFNVRFWGVGNENWGCGGNMTGAEYATEYRRFSTFLRGYGETRPFLVACGPNQNDTAWTKDFLATVRPRGRGGPPRGGAAPMGPTMGYAMHYYSNGQLEATKFNVEAMQRQLSSFARIEEAIVQQRQLLDAVDPNRTMGLMMDEWGVWDRIPPEDTKKYGALWMQSTLRSAVAAAMGLNVFHHNAGTLYMCNIAQIVNVLQSVILCWENDCVRTTTYYAHELQKPHRGKISVRTETGDPTPLGISVSASKRDRELVLTLVNPKHDVTMRVDCGVTGGSPASATARLLHHADFNACNTFENPNVVVPRDHAASVQGGRVQTDLPPVSVASVIVRLA